MAFVGTVLLTSDTLPDFQFRAAGRGDGEGALRIIDGSWVSTETGDGTVVESFGVFSNALKPTLRAVVRALDQYRSIVAETKDAPTPKEQVYLVMGTAAEPARRRARVLSIDFVARDNAIVNQFLTRNGALYDVSIEREATWEAADEIVAAWTGVEAAGDALTVPNLLNSATAAASVPLVNITTEGNASFDELWMGFKSMVGGEVNAGLFDPVIKVNISTIVNKTYTSPVADESANDDSAAIVRFASEDGATDRTMYKPRFTVKFDDWNDSIVLPATAWREYAGRYHLLCRYKTYAPDGTDTEAPFMSIGGINIVNTSWTERMTRQYITHTSGVWRVLDLGVLTLGGGTGSSAARFTSYSKSEVGIAAGLVATKASLSASELQKIYSTISLWVDDFTLVPADNFVHVKSSLSVSRMNRMLITSEGGSTAAAVAERAGTALNLSGGNLLPPYNILEAAEVNATNWLCPPWTGTQLVIRAARDGQPIDETLTISARIQPRTRSYA